MEMFLGLLLPALTAVIIKLSKIEDNSLKVLLSLLVACVVGIPLWLALGRAFDLPKIMEFIAGLYGVGQATYQTQKAVRGDR